MSTVKASRITGYASVFRDTDQPISNSTSTIVEPTLIEFDEFGFWDADNFRFVIPPGFGGLYSIVCQIQWDNDSTGGRRLDIESSIGRLASLWLSGQSSTAANNYCASVDEVLEPGDTVHAEVFQNSGISLDLQATTEGTSNTLRFSLVRIQEA